VTDVTPDWKQVTEGGIGRPKPRGRRTHRQEWRRLHEMKGGDCRICGATGKYDLHHLVPRARSGGPINEPWNLVPLCRPCHLLVTMNDPPALSILETRLTDGERYWLEAYGGPGIFARLFGV
jgi:5-methylcytosine-specific restriction endonuclease McrA